jgi:hypothetical protein
MAGFVNAVMNLLVIKARNVLTSCGKINFSSGSLLQEVSC